MRYRAGCRAAGLHSPSPPLSRPEGTRRSLCKQQTGARGLKREHHHPPYFREDRAVGSSRTLELPSSGQELGFTSDLVWDGAPISKRGSRQQVCPCPKAHTRSRCVCQVAGPPHTQVTTTRRGSQAVCPVCCWQAPVLLPLPTCLHQEILPDAGAAGISWWSCPEKGLKNCN